jgi:peptidoglycan hydrolase CwlO-like protein
MGWIVDLLNLNAKVFNLLSDVEALNKRIVKIDDDVRDLGRELYQLKGFLAAAQLDVRSDKSDAAEKIDQVQKKVDALLEKLEVSVTSRKVIWLFPEQLWLQFVPVLDRLQGCLAAKG